MVIGKKYETLFTAGKSGFLKYAEKCKADLKIVAAPPDPSFYRPLLSQKLLIPSLFSGYDEGLYLDLDILIGDAPCVFDIFPAEKAFGAVIDPRSTEEFIETWKHIERIPKETTADYFTSRNFQFHPHLQGSINGGVFLFRSGVTAELFEQYYYSDHNQGGLNSFEETPMAYLTQVNNTFFSMPPEFNVQMLYKLKGTPEGKKIVAAERKFPALIKKRYYKKSGNIFYPLRSYNRFLKIQLQKSYFLHFAGGFPFRN